MTPPAQDAADAGALSIVSDSPAETNTIGQAIGAMLSPGDVICLNGDLGAGKTHLAQGIAAGAGVTGPVTSPTFTLVNEYEGRLPLAHFDFYRLERAGELDDIGFDEYLDGTRAVVIEWANRFGECLPDERLDIRIDIGGDRRRILRLSGAGTLIRRVVDSLTQRRIPASGAARGDAR